MRIKKFGQISDVHIPPSIRRRAYDLEMGGEATRIYTETGGSEYLVLSVSVENYQWTFHTWTQPVVGDEYTVAANAAEVEFVKNIHALQTKYELDYIESPELYHRVSDELPRYAADEDEDDDLDDGPSDGGEE